MKGRGKFFKIRDDGTSPAFLNTYAVVITYILITIFYIKEFQCLAEDQRQDGVYCLNLFITNYGVSTITYVLGVCVQNFAIVKKGDDMFSEIAWLLGLCIVYSILYALFIPRPYGLNIFLTVFTLFLVFYASNCVYKISETGQAKDNNMDYRGIT